jgi:proteasome lid subunit RPN8/RPN11
VFGWRKKKSKDAEAKPPAKGGASRAESAKPGGGDAAKVSAGGWTEKKRNLKWQKFPVSGPLGEPMRVNFSRDAYANLVSHAKENLEVEVCGVLAGELCEDDQGEYVSVEAALRGKSGKHGASHVTYTQETWNQIHERMERDYPKLEIVGWYHSHPGFGVAFSDMDMFIQKNFFSGRGQIAFVSDPLGGDEAICVQTAGGTEFLKRFWVDGRERQCRVGPGAPAPGGGGAAARPAAGPEMAQALRRVEERLGQTMQALEELRTTHYRFLMTAAMMVSLGVVFWIGWTVWKNYATALAPPEDRVFAPAPVKIGDEWAWIGSQVVLRKLSPREAEALQEIEKLQQELIEAQKKKKEAEKGEKPSAPASDKGAKPAGKEAPKEPAKDAPKATPPAPGKAPEGKTP